jgi:hypothetical protein
MEGGFERWVRFLEGKGIKVLRSFYGVDFVLRTSFGEAIVTASLHSLSGFRNPDPEYGIVEIQVTSTEKKPEDFKKFVFEVKRLLGLRTSKIRFSRADPDVLQEKIEKLKKQIESQPPTVFFEWEVEKMKRMRKATKYPEALSKISDIIHANITRNRDVTIMFKEKPEEDDLKESVIKENGRIVATVRRFYDPLKRGDMSCEITVYDRDLLEEVEKVYEYVSQKREG